MKTNEELREDVNSNNPTSHTAEISQRKAARVAGFMFLFYLLVI
jgi:hypothetical protein